MVINTATVTELCFLSLFLATPWGTLVPWPGIEPVPPALQVQSLSHWTAREVSELYFHIAYLGLWGFSGSSADKDSTWFRRPQFNSWVGKIPCRRDRLPTPVFLGFLGGSDGKEFSCNAGDLSSTPGLGRSPGGGHGNPLQYFYFFPLQYCCLEKPHGQRSLAGYSPWGHKESERLSTAEHLGL